MQARVSRRRQLATVLALIMILAVTLSVPGVASAQDNVVKTREEDKALLEEIRDLVAQAGAKLAQAKDQAAAGDGAAAVATVQAYFGIIGQIAAKIPAPHARPTPPTRPTPPAPGGPEPGKPAPMHRLPGLGELIEPLRGHGPVLAEILKALPEASKQGLVDIIKAAREQAKADKIIGIVLRGIGKIMQGHVPVEKLEEQLEKARQAVEKTQDRIAKLATREAELADKIRDMQDGPEKEFARGRLAIIRVEMEAATKHLEASQMRVRLLQEMIEYYRGR
jgi:cell division protein FtsB